MGNPPLLIMIKLTYFIFFFSVIFSSCNSSPIELIGLHDLDRDQTEVNLLDSLNIKDVKLKLNDDNTFEILTYPDCDCAGLSGKWKRKSGFEANYYEIESMGAIATRQTLAFAVNCGKFKLTLYFRE